MRLDKYLANSGVGSRKEVKILIRKKRISVDGVIAKSDSIDIKEGINHVYLDGEEIIYKEFYYVLLNKPQGYISSVEPGVYPPVTDLIPEYAFANLFPVGRLDVDTTGTLLLTNDGELCHQLLAPKYHVDKTYYVEVDGKMSDKLIKAFKEGIMMDGELTLPGDLVILSEHAGELTIHQGKFHQVKRMFKHFGLNVTKLDRKTFAFLNHEDLELGEYRELSLEEENALKNLVKH
ncbi:MAG: rRNA pseudouridine synthase [Bacilli bacterium]|nr:rRNA pseudouridine synthase [Bacilli bacterium]